MGPPTSLDSVAHVVQVALTPVFLLSGVAALLNVFATRLARVADQVDALSRLSRNAQAEDHQRRLRSLKLRSNALDWAVVLAAVAGVLTCGATLTLFIGAIGAASAAGLLFALFGGAVVCTMGALAAFVLEMILTGRMLRRRADAAR